MMRLLFRRRSEKLDELHRAVNRHQNRALVAVAERRWDEAFRAITLAREVHQILERLQERS